MSLDHADFALNLTMNIIERKLDNVTNQFNASIILGTSPSQQTIPWSVILKWSILLAMIPFNLIGNGLTLAAVLTNESLWTKTNLILASLTVVDIFTMVLVPPVFMFNVNGYLNRNPCGYGDLDHVMQGIGKLTSKVSINHLIVVAIDRYVAINHPFAYEKSFTDKVKLKLTSLLRKLFTLKTNVQYWHHV
jgi:hypothetical protein